MACSGRTRLAADAVTQGPSPALAKSSAVTSSTCDSMGYQRLPAVEVPAGDSSNIVKRPSLRCCYRRNALFRQSSLQVVHPKLGQSRLLGAQIAVRGGCRPRACTAAVSACPLTPACQLGRLAKHPAGPQSASYPYYRAHSASSFQATSSTSAEA